MLSKKNGFSYMMVLIMAAGLFLLASAMSAVIYSRAMRMEKEKELIFRGLEYKKAIKSYIETGSGEHQPPLRLEDLLSDPRYSDKKHIRRLYREPVTNGDWNLILDDDNRIVGVSSRSCQKPLKTKGFPDELKNFESAQTYRDWIFIAK